MPYTLGMIRSYRSKASQRFAQTGGGSRLPVQNQDRVRRILAALAAASDPDQMNIPGFRFHCLQGKPKRYSVDASGSYRVTFGFKG